MKRALKIILISLVSICVLAVAAVYVLLTQIDFNAYKESIVKIVYNATGRQLTIGDIQVKPSFNPVIEVQDVTFSNAEWSKTPTMVSAQSVELGFAVIPLLHKNIEIDTFRLNDAVINLEENASGEANWEFSADKVGAAIQKGKKAANFSLMKFELVKSAQAAVDETDTETKNAEPAGAIHNDTGGSSVSQLLSSLIVRHVLLSNVKINYTDKKAKQQSYDITELALDENDSGDIDFNFDVNHGLYRGSGILGSLNKLESASGYPLSGTFDVAGIHAEAAMMLYDLLTDIRFNGTVKASGFLGENSGYNEFADIMLQGDLKEIKADIKSFRIAGNEIKGTATANIAASIPTVKAKLQSGRFDLATFAKKQQAAVNFSLIKEAQATALVPADVIPYSALYGINADVNASVSRLVNGNSEIANNIVADVQVKNGTAVLKVIKGTVVDGSVTANASLNAASKSMVLQAEVQKLNMQKLLQALGKTSSSFNFINGSDTDVYVSLSGRGDTYAAVADSLDGRIVAIVDKSQVHLGNIGVMKGNVVSQLLNTLKITKGNDDLNLRCAVVRADLKNGKASFPNGVVVNADKFTIVASGDVNLRDDSVSMSVKPFAGKLTDTNIAKALSSLVKLTGTIQNPRIGVDSANAIKTIVGVTTGGPVYLGTQMLLENDGSPCYTALQGTGYESRFPKPDNVVTQTTGDVGKILDDSVGVVKDTTKGILNILSGGVGKRGKTN